MDDTLYTSTADVHPGVRGHILNIILRTVVKPHMRSLDIDIKTVQSVRDQLESLARRFQPHDDLLIEESEICGVVCERLQANTTAKATILYIHGGAFFCGSPLTHRGITRPLAVTTGFNLVVPEYRLMPEHQFPAALHDVLAVYRGLLESEPAKSIAIAGDSAGGNLVLALLHALKAEGLAMPACAVCLSPWTDLTGSGASVRSNIARDPFLPGERMTLAAHLYLGDAYPRQALASPLFGDFTGFPTLLFHVGTTEILLDDSTRCVDKARKAGVEAHLRLWPDLPHVFHAFSSVLPAARVALDEVADFIRRFVKA